MRHLHSQDLFLLYNSPTGQLVAYTNKVVSQQQGRNRQNKSLKEPSFTYLAGKTPESHLKFSFKGQSFAYITTENSLIYAKLEKQSDIEETHGFKSKNFKEFKAPYKQQVKWCTLIDENRVIAITQQGEFYYIDFENQGENDGVLDPEIAALGLSDDEEENYNPEVKGVNFMGLRESDEAVEIYAGFNQIVVSDCQTYMAFLFVNKLSDGKVQTRIEIWLTGEFNFMNQEIYKIKEYSIDGYARILDFSMWINHSQVMIVGKGQRRVNSKLCYETVEFYSINDGKLKGELPGVMMGQNSFVKNAQNEYMTTLFSDSGDDVALMILRPI